MKVKFFLFLLLTFSLLKSLLEEDASNLDPA
jgi:hypothetical protein